MKAAAPTQAQPVGGDLLGVFKEITLVDNFEYGETYQAVLSNKSLMNGHKIVPGETYTLKVTYSTSRDLEDDVLIGLVDTSPSVNYWKWLTPDGDDMPKIPKSKAGQSVSATIKLTTTAGASADAATSNALAFETKGEGTKGRKGSGKQKAVKFTFTEFVFTKD